MKLRPVPAKRRADTPFIIQLQAREAAQAFGRALRAALATSQTAPTATTKVSPR